MRIVVWNMSHWQRRRDHINAWNYLESLRPDFALLQEAVPPSDWPADRLVYRDGGIDAKRRWGSAVISFQNPVSPIVAITLNVGSRPHNLLGTHPGTVAIAETVIRGHSYALCSVYGLIDNGYATTTMHRILSDLTPLFDAAEYRGRCVLGGDLNVCTQWHGANARANAVHRTVFDRLAAFGLESGTAAFIPPDRGRLAGCKCTDSPCFHVRTQRHKDDPRSYPWDNDYVFMSAKLIPHLTACAPDTGDSAWKWSSHCPVIADFDL